MLCINANKTKAIIDWAEIHLTPPDSIEGGLQIRGVNRGLEWVSTPNVFGMNSTTKRTHFRTSFLGTTSYICAASSTKIVTPQGNNLSPQDLQQLSSDGTRRAKASAK
jgi:hypothetical protein